MIATSVKMSKAPLAFQKVTWQGVSTARSSLRRMIYPIETFARNNSPWRWKMALKCNRELGTHSPKNNEHLKICVERSETLGW
jgi:hypothetical protein